MSELLYLSHKQLVKIRIPITDRFVDYWGKPMYGGVFGNGEWALVAVDDPSFTLLTVAYLVMHIRSGLPICERQETKGAAIRAAREMLSKIDRSRLPIVFAKLLREAEELDKHLDNEARAQREALERQREEQRGSNRREKAGYVYLIQCRDLYKIGKAVDVGARVKQLCLSADAEVIATGFFERPHKVESELHRAYKLCRQKGEWFRLTPDDVEAIKARLAKPELRAVS